MMKSMKCDSAMLSADASDIISSRRTVRRDIKLKEKELGENR